jgi:hypothetical protein
MTRRWWTAAERAWVRGHWGVLGCAEMGRRLGRGPGAVCEAARRLGLTKRHRPTGSYEAEIRRGHARGESDHEIAARLGLCREAVGYHRRRLGLPSTAGHERQRRKVAAGVRRQCAREGMASLVEIRWAAHRVECLRRGWPRATSPRQCDLLDLLAAGPRTKRQLQAGLGLAPDGGGAVRPWVGEMLRCLRGLGLVVSRGRVHRPGGRGRNQCVYALAPGVAREFRPGAGR